MDERKGNEYFLYAHYMSGSAPEIYIHDLIYSPQEPYKADFFSQIRKLRIRD